MALLGENYFPPMNNSHTSHRRGKGLEKIMGAILYHQPSVMYICPTRGVNINLIPLIMMNNIPFRLVFPSKSFFSTLTEDEKCILDAACSVADKVIILSQHQSDPLRWSDDWFRASKKVVVILNRFWQLTLGRKLNINKFCPILFNKRLPIYIPVFV